MRIIDKRWNCYEIVHNDRYIVTLGTGITVRERSTFALIHHFTGIRWIGGGAFVNDDVLMVYTGEQKLFFFSIEQKKLLWAVTRPKELASSGDMRCIIIPGTEKIACIAHDRKNYFNRHLMILDWKMQELSIKKIPGCYRVVSKLVWTEELGLSFLSEQAKGDNATVLYRIHCVDNDGNISILFDEESKQHLMSYSGHYLIMYDDSGQFPVAIAYPLEISAVRGIVKLDTAIRLTIPTILTDGLFTNRRVILPNICWIDEKAGILITCNRMKTLGIYDFLNQKMIAEYCVDKVFCGKLLDGQLLIGCTPGFCVETILSNE